MDNGMTFTPLFLGVGVIVALVAGFAAGGFMAAEGADNTAAPAQNTAGNSFSLDDRNFLVNLANSQVALTSNAVIGQLDWCIANGGVWNVLQQPAQVQVSEEVAGQIQQQGNEVFRTADGNWIANVVVISRDTCIFPVRSQ